MQVGGLALQLGDARAHSFGASVDLQQSKFFLSTKIADMLRDTLEARVHQVLQRAQFGCAGDLIGKLAHLRGDRIAVSLRVLEVTAVGVIRIGQVTGHFLEPLGDLCKNLRGLQAFALQEFAMSVDQVGRARHDIAQGAVILRACQFSDQCRRHRIFRIARRKALEQRFDREPGLDIRRWEGDRGDGSGRVDGHHRCCQRTGQPG